MKKSFVTGLAILLPLVISILFAMWVINLFTKPFLPIVSSLLEQFDLLERHIGFLSAREVLLYTSRLLIFVLLLGFTFIVGVLMRWYVVHRFLRFFQWFIHRIPLVNKVYKASHEVISTLFHDDMQSFREVVLVPYPHKKSLSLAFVSRSRLPAYSSMPDNELVSVFLPGSPNPTMGFMLLFQPKQIIPIDMKVEEALRCIVSCGALSTHLKEQKKNIEAP